MICYLNLKWWFLLVIQWWNCICFFAFCCCFCLSWSLKLRPGGLWDILAAAKKKLRQHDARSCKRWSMMTSNWLWCPSRFFITNFLCVASRQIAKPQTQRHRPPTTGDNRSVCRQEPRSFFLVVPAAGGGAKTPMAIEAQVIGLISKFRGAAGHWEETVVGLPDGVGHWEWQVMRSTFRSVRRWEGRWDGYGGWAFRMESGLRRRTYCEICWWV